MRNSSRGDVDPFIVMDVMESARQAEAEGRRIIHMEVGQPGSPAPKRAQEAVRQAMAQNPLGYTVAMGNPSLRAAIAGLYQKWYGIEINPERIIITPGASGAFILTFAAFFDAGERVGIGIPGYPSYRQILRAQNLEPILIETHRSARFQPLPDQVRAQPLDGLLIASPANPSGTMLDRPKLAALIEAAKEQGAAFISDEIYHGLDYDRPPISALSITDECVVINSFSKYFSMTGWRVGWMVVPETHIRQVERLAQNMFICTPHVSQIAAEAALGSFKELDANISIYARNRQKLIEALPHIGLGAFAPPDGAFYLYIDVSNITNDSRALCADILDKAGVAITPGLDFDPKRGHHFIRLSYARSAMDIDEGIKRLAHYFSAER